MYFHVCELCSVDIYLSIYIHLGTCKHEQTYNMTMYMYMYMCTLLHGLVVYVCLRKTREQTHKHTNQVL